MRRPIILISCAIALVAAGCGGDDDKKSESTAPASAAVSGGSAESGLLAGVQQSTGPSKLDLALSVKIDGVPAAAGAAGALLTQPINLKVSGVSDSAAKSSDVDIALDLGALALNAKLLSDGTKQWIQYDDVWYELDTGALAGAAGGVTGGTTTAPSVDTGKIKSALSDPSKYFKELEEGRRREGRRHRDRAHPGHARRRGGAGRRQVSSAAPPRRPSAPSRRSSSPTPSTTRRSTSGSARTTASSTGSPSSSTVTSPRSRTHRA